MQIFLKERESGLLLLAQDSQRWLSRDNLVSIFSRAFKSVCFMFRLTPEIQSYTMSL